MVALAALMVTAPVAPASAQVPTQQELQQLLQTDPNAVRERLRQSGLSDSEVRARLSAAGLPTSALDAFLSGSGAVSSGANEAQTLAALRALGIDATTQQGLTPITLEVGAQTGPRFATSRGDSRIFGLDVFRRSTTQFQPLLTGPVPEDYRLGAGDEMVLVLTGDVELAYELQVTREGFVVVPNVGQIRVANVTMAGFRNLLRNRLGRSYSGIATGTTTFDVTVSRLRANQIYVIGEVVQPGAYQLASVATVLNALYAAGGPTALGSMRDIEIRRGSGEVVPLDLYPYLLQGDVSGDVVLEQGNVIFVPLKGRRVSLVGSILRPADYELAGADDLVDVLRAGGGFAPDARRQRVTIHRVLRPTERSLGLADRVALDIGLRAAPDSTNTTYLGGVTVPPVGLQDGDSIVVDEVPDLQGGYYVTVTGRVRAPGQFPWQEGLTLRELIELAGGPTVGADLRDAEIARLPLDRSAGELAELFRVPMDSSYLSRQDADVRFAGPPGVDFPPPGASPEFVLGPFDRVTILQQPDFEMQRSVKITGEIPVPGEYTLRSKSDRLSDLVERAGGLLPTGYAEGARLIRSEAQGRIDVELNLALEDPLSVNNIVLEPGDSLHIPIYSPTVRVTGAVNSAVTVLYREGEGLDYYIENAGGYRRDADKGRTSVRFANGQARLRGKFLFWSRYPDPGPGSTVAVPAKDPADRTDVRGLVSDLVAVLGSLTTVIIVLTR